MRSTPVTVAVLVALAAGLVPCTLRWLRVAQREHYGAGAATRFALRWWALGPANTTLGLTGLVAAAVSPLVPPTGFVVAGVVAVGPLGLGVRGRTSKLAWTRRLRTLAAVTAALDVGIVVVVGLLTADLAAAAAAAALVAALQPALVDAALALLAPLERRLGRRYVHQATGRLREVDPAVVAITGSYGKTSTKQLVRHLVAGSRSVVASPASFNNAAGLSRAVNEGLPAGTEVFVAEMGMWGQGEIRALCAWVHPDVAVICAIGPVHLERVGSLDAIVDAKAEIVESVGRAVLNVDAYRLEEVAHRVEARGGDVVRCSAGGEGATSADVVVIPADGDLVVRLHGAEIGRAPRGSAQPGNLACAVGTCVALGLDPAAIGPRLASLPQPEHRQEVVTTPAGVTVIDNTFSSNPASAASSLERLSALGRPDRRRVVVTPGMIELGRLQYRENLAFGEDVGRTATDLVVVGHTNRRALVEGATGGAATVRVVPTRDEAVAWVRATLAAGDTVLYENDLPDHYP